MKLEYYKKALALMVIPFFIASCELLGLDYQDSYDYDYSAGMPSNKIDMSAFEFIKSRTDIFSLLEEAILYAGVENEFKQSGVTYLLPTNTAFNSETSTDLSYFQTHQLTYIDEETGELVSYAPISMTAYPKEQVKEFLLYHIVKGKYTFTNLPAEPTWFETVATADTANPTLYSTILMGITSLPSSHAPPIFTMLTVHICMSWIVGWIALQKNN